jgi:hypothetical protein
MSRLLERSSGEGIDLGESGRQAVHAGKGPQRVRSNEVRDRPVVLPEPNVPEESTVREEVQAGSRAVRAGDREAELSDLSDAQARSATNGLRCR